MQSKKRIHRIGKANKCTYWNIITEDSILTKGEKMHTLQEKAINAARTVLFNKFGYNVNEITQESMYIVWFCKTLQNWKALVSGVNIKEYIEVTYNGDTQEVYVDVYKKAYNKCLKDGCGVLND